MKSTMQSHPLSVARILEYGASVHARTTVTTFRDGRAEEQTQAETGVRTAALAHALHEELGISGDQRVASFMFNCSEHLETLFATASMGAVFHPLNKNLLNSQIAKIIAHAHDEVIVADPRLCDQLGEILHLLGEDNPVRAVVLVHASDAAALDTVRGSLPAGVEVHSYESLLDGRSTVYNWPTLDEETAAVLCYTTGTTGEPKGVAYSHRSLYLSTMVMRTTDSFAIAHGVPFLCCVPIYHVLSWGVPLAAFLTGAPLILPDADVSAPTLARLIEETHPRMANGVPTIWMQLMVHYLQNPPRRMSLSEIFVGGSPVPPILIRLWEERYGVDVIHVWGMTETFTAATVARPPSGASGEARETYRTSQGRFTPLLEYRVVKDDQVVSATDHNQGEIQVRGNLVTADYYGDLAEEDQGMVTAEGWLRTGDVGSITSDGYLTVEDRARDVIRSGGEWIYSVVVENLVMSHPDVVEAAVIGYPDKTWGERPLSVTVLHEGVAPNAETAEKIREHLRASLPSWMLPEYWTFVEVIDKTSVNKFDKKDLRAHLADGDYDIVALPGPGSKKA